MRIMNKDQIIPLWEEIKEYDYFENIEEYNKFYEKLESFFHNIEEVYDWKIEMDCEQLNIETNRTQITIDYMVIMLLDIKVTKKIKKLIKALKSLNRLNRQLNNFYKN